MKYSASRRYIGWHLLLGAVYVLMFLAVSSCQQPAYRGVEVIEQPASSQMIEALLTISDIPDFEARNEWYPVEPSTITEEWNWSNPVTVVISNIGYGVGQGAAVPATHVIAKYSSDEVALSVWEALLDDKIRDEFAYSVTESVNLLPNEGRPDLLADDTWWRCEQYYGEDDWNSCIAQLRYGRYYTHLIYDIDNRELSVEQFFNLVVLLDQRMQVLISTEQ